MKTKLTKIILAIIASFSLLSLTTIPAFAECTDICTCDGVSPEVRAAAGCPGTSTITIQDVITNILYTVIGITGIVAVIFIIVGGVGYMTSSGDSAKLKKAKDTILYAVIGLVVAALAFTITNFAISVIDGSELERQNASRQQTQDSDSSSSEESSDSSSE